MADVPAELILRLLTGRVLTLRLFANDIDPGAKVKTFEEMTGAGYRPVKLSPLAWDIDTGGAKHPPVEFRFSGKPARNPRGYYIPDPDWPELVLAAELFDDVPEIRTDGDTVEVSPELVVKS